ncbi:hypothetical protein QL285_048955 [Trifolium repens]|nr:hypothetical protein QL285_048955 [Trifolium repens]
MTLFKIFKCVNDHHSLLVTVLKISNILCFNHHLSQSTTILNIPDLDDGNSDHDDTRKRKRGIEDDEDASDDSDSDYVEDNVDEANDGDSNDNDIDG